MTEGYIKDTMLWAAELLRASERDDVWIRDAECVAFCLEQIANHAKALNTIKTEG
jgi:hypothetical protein